MRKSVAQSDMGTVGALLRDMGLRYSFDNDGDITFTMRLPGEAIRPEDGLPDWSRLRYSMQPDFSIIGEFTGGEFTDWAKRIVRFYLIGSKMSAGVLGIHAYPRVVPAKFAASAHIRVVPTRNEADAFNRSGASGLHATHFNDLSFAVTAGISGVLSDESLRGAISVAQTAAGNFLEGQFRGWMVTELA